MDNEKQKKLGLLENKLNLCLKNVNEMKSIISDMRDDIKSIKKNIIDIDYKIPERKRGYLWDTCDAPKPKPVKVDYDSVR